MTLCTTCEKRKKKSKSPLSVITSNKNDCQISEKKDTTTSSSSLNNRFSSLIRQCWSSLGILLVIFQLSAHFLSSVVSTNKINSILLAFKRSTNDSILNIHVLVDTYFFIDVIVRLNSSRFTPISINQSEKSSTQTSRTQYLRICWLIIDLILIFPSGIFRQVWQSRPALQLLNIRRGRRPIFEFFRNKEFRKKVFQLIAEHRAERKMFTGKYIYFIFRIL